QRRIFQERSGDGDALALSPRQLYSAIANDGRKAPRQCLDEISAPGKIRCLDDLIIRRIGAAVADVLLCGSMKQREILGYGRNGGAQAFLRDARDILSVDGDAAVLKIIEALD